MQGHMPSAGETGLSKSIFLSDMFVLLLLGHECENLLAALGAELVEDLGHTRERFDLGQLLGLFGCWLIAHLNGIAFRIGCPRWLPSCPLGRVQMRSACTWPHSFSRSASSTASCSSVLPNIPMPPP